VINTSNASDQPIAWFILSPKVPDKAGADKLAAQHPNLKPELDRAYSAQSAGLTMLRLRRLAEKDERVRAWMPPERDITTLRKYCEDFIESAFERVEGVSNSNVFGGREEELQVIIDPEKLAARGLTINDVRQALRGQNEDTSGGDYWEGKRRYIVRTLGQFRSPEQVDNAILSRAGDAPVYVRDIGRAELSYKKPDGFVRRFGTECIAVNAQRTVGANVLEVIERLKVANQELNDNLLGAQGLELTMVYDESAYIRSSVSLVRDNLLWGSLFTFVTLLVFLRSARSTVIIFAHILISTIGAFLVMAAMGRSLNVPALGGLAFAVGMLVDNAIVMLENIYRRHQLGESPETASVKGASEVWGALLNATLANLAVFIPVLFIREEAGQLFRDIAIAISAAVALSMLVAVAVVPTAAMRMLKRNDELDHGHGQNGAPARRRSGWRAAVDPLLGVFDRVAMGAVELLLSVNRNLQRGVLPRLALVLVVIVVSCAASWFLLPKVEYLPNGNQNLVFAILLPPPGYNLDQLGEIGTDVERSLAPYWDVDPDDPKVKEQNIPIIADFFFVARNRNVFLGVRAADPMRAADLVPVIRSLTEKSDKMSGTFLVAQQRSLFERGLTAGRTIDVEVTGPDIEKLVALGGQMFGQISQIMPTAQVFPKPSLDLANPEVWVTPKWEQAADMQVTAADLGYTVDALVDGAYATDYYQGGDKIDLRIVGKEQFAKSSQALKSLPVATPTGQLVPLEAVAFVDVKSGPEQINRRTRQRAITLQVTPALDMPLEAAMDQITTQVIDPLQASGQLQGGYNVQLAGTADKLRSTWQSLRLNLALAVLITYLLMAATFESWVYPFVVIVTVPIGAVGGFLGLWLLNWYVLQPLDVLTMLGFIMLVGTVVNNPILIVEQALLHVREDDLPISEAVVESVRTRIRPIFMTTLGGLAGLLPLVLAPGAGSELYRGIGAVLLGGLLVSTVVTLVFVPALLSLMMQLQDYLWPRRRRMAEEADEAVRPTLPIRDEVLGPEPARA
jgi:HAE1 family hydrophobic/amphiphilic exporter-1